MMVAAAALALCLCGCITGGSDTDNGNGNGSGNNNGTDNANTTPTTSVTVSDLTRTTGVYKDPNGDQIPFAYALPKVDGPDTDYIFGINDFVAQVDKDYVQTSLDAMQQGGYLGWPTVDYQAHAIGNMISVCLYWQGYFTRSDFGFQTWLIKADGTKAENAELFAAKGVTEAQVLAKVREQLPEPDYATIEASAGKEMVQMVKDAYEKTISDANINGHLGFYLNGDGHLEVIVKEYSVAGAECYYKTLDLGL